MEYILVKLGYAAQVIIAGIGVYLFCMLLYNWINKDWHYVPEMV